MTGRERWAAGLLVATFSALTLPFSFWPVSGLLPDLPAYGLYCLLAAGLAAEVAELVLALCWSPEQRPRVASPAPRKETAVVMVVCDDWSEDHLLGLGPLAAAGYDVFLLDDSRRPAELPETLQGRVAHLRRGTRAGAKAGNLNHWLATGGGSYRYAVVLDADSRMSVDAVDALALTAEHPAQADVAVLQSKIVPEPRPGSLFSRLLAAAARPRARVFERVHDRLGLVLSFGHNQLVRLAPVRALGGFDETFSNEDTVLTLQLAARGWRTVLVDVWSQDGSPPTVAAFNRRTVRWACQTVELFRHPWRPVPLRLKLLLCRHLVMYLFPLIGALLLGLSLWTGPDSPTAVWAFMAAALSFAPGYVLYGLALWPVTAVFAGCLALRLALARREGLGWRTILASAVLGNAPSALLLLPMSGAMLATALGRRVRFVPTNSRIAQRQDASPLRRLGRAVPAALLLATLLAGGVSRPGSLLVGFNALWLAMLLASPLSLLVLWAVDRRQRAPGGSPTA